jgi:uncharacterized protein (TIGR02117 family)
MALPYAAVQTADSAPRLHSVYAAGHGWHVGLIMPAKPLFARIPALSSRFPKADLLELGWGDKGFYQASEITPALAFQAMFFSRGAVMHLVSIPDSKDAPFDYFTESEIVEICVSDQELSALTEFVQQSFQFDATQQLVPLNKGIYGDGQFYEAEGRYHLLNTCNKWVAKALSSMGFDIAPTFALTAGALLNKLKASDQAVRVMANGVSTMRLKSSTACVVDALK